MKKNIIGCLLVVSIITILTACSNNISNNISNEKLENFQNEKNEIENISGELVESGNFFAQNDWKAKDIDLNAIKETIIEVGDMDKPTVITNDKVSELYGLQNFEGIESVLIIEENEATYQEIAIIKLANEGQCDEIFEHFITRYENLADKKTKYPAAFNLKESVSMTQQAGVGIMVISANKDDIVNAINEYF